MTRRRYVAMQVDGVERWVEVPLDYVQDGYAPSVQDSVLWNDRAYQDMGDPRFVSRSQHREYMKRHGLTTVDDFLGGTWKMSEAARIAAKNGVDPSRQRDIIQAIHKLKERSRG